MGSMDELRNVYGKRLDELLPRSMVDRANYRYNAILYF